MGKVPCRTGFPSSKPDWHRIFRAPELPYVQHPSCSCWLAQSQKRSRCPQNWQTAYPTILYSTWKHTGDDQLIKSHWPHLERYLAWYARKLSKFHLFSANPFRRTANGSIDDTQFPGDWCPPPAAQGQYRNASMSNAVDIRSGLGEAECGHTGWDNAHSRFTNASLFTAKPLSSASSYLNDKRMIAELGRAINATGPGVVGITADDKQNFRESFLHGDHFGSGGPAAQTENVLPLLLGLTANEEQEQSVLDYLLNDIMVKHRNHTTSRTKSNFIRETGSNHHRNLSNPPVVKSQ